MFFQGNSTTVFSNNIADYGGGIYIFASSKIFFQENSTTLFSNNIADYGGASYIHFYFKQYSYYFKKHPLQFLVIILLILDLLMLKTIAALPLMIMLL